MSARTVSASLTLGGEHDTKPSMIEFIVTSSAGTPLRRIERRTYDNGFATDKKRKREQKSEKKQKKTDKSGGGQWRGGGAVNEGQKKKKIPGTVLVAAKHKNRGRRAGRGSNSRPTLLQQRKRTRDVTAPKKHRPQ